MPIELNILNFAFAPISDDDDGKNELHMMESEDGFEDEEEEEEGAEDGKLDDEDEGEEEAEQ